MFRQKIRLKLFLISTFISINALLPVTYAQEKTKNPTIEKQSLTDSLKIKLYTVIHYEPTKYTFLTVNNLYNNKEYHDLFFTDKKADLKTMRKLSSYISEKYKIQLEISEQIVLNTYKESVLRNIEPLLLLSLIGTESSYQSKSISGMGAVGLTQVMPVYHTSKIQNLKKENLDLWSISGNIKLGSEILKEYLDLSNGNMIFALQRYNGSLNDKSQTYSKKIFTELSSLEQVASL